MLWSIDNARSRNLKRNIKLAFRISNKETLLHAPVTRQKGLCLTLESYTHWTKIMFCFFSSLNVTRMAALTT